MGQGQGRELPFDVGAKYDSLSGKTIWSVHAGRRKSTSETVTVFMFDFTDRSEDEIKFAQSAHLRLKTLRHPNIVRYIDGVEFPSCIYVVTEKVCPLEDHLSTREGYSEFATRWGLHQIVKAVGFLSTDCGLVHRNICLSSIFVDEAGEWKLGGVEFMHPFGDSHVPRKSLEFLWRYDPPEASKPAATARRAEKWSTDVWGLGCLVWEVFNGPLPQVSALRNTSKIPKSLLSHYCEFVSANPRSRPNPTVLLSSLREHGGYLSNPFISIALRLEELQIMETTQRNEFFNELNKSLDSFPESFAKRKILPQLLNAFEFGGAGSAVLAPLFKLGKMLDNAEYQKRIVPCVVKLFSSTDRATRLNLLQQLENFIDHLQPSTVNDQIFPHVSTGFTDTVPALREQTIKSMVLIAPKLSESTVNSQLLKYFAKCQLDEQPGIRTNTNICLGKIASYLNPSTRQKVLVSAFLRSLKDPFPPARCAGIGSMAATHTFYTTTDIATRLLPALCTMTVDKEKAVRDQAFQVIKLFLGKLETLSEDPEAAAQQQKTEAAATSWTGWAMSSLTSKFYKPPPSAATPSSTSTGTGGGKEQERQKSDGAPVSKETSNRQLPDRKEEEEELRKEGWDDDEWEDFDTPSADTRPQEEGEGSDMEEWEDDGWGVLESSVEPLRGRPAQTSELRTPATMSSGADFFDTFQTTSRTKSKGDDFFESFGTTASGSKGRKERSPPPVSPTLFGGKKKEEEEEEGWGDWGGDFSSSSFSTRPAQQQSKKVGSTQSAGKALKLGTKKEPPMFTMGADTSAAGGTKAAGSGSGSSEGWDFGSDWGSFDSPSSATTASGMAADDASGLSRQELLQKRREERRLKQQAAREKRAAGASLKPGGLGAVKKD